MTEAIVAINLYCSHGMVALSTNGNYSLSLALDAKEDVYFLKENTEQGIHSVINDDEYTFGLMTAISAEMAEWSLESVSTVISRWGVRSAFTEKDGFPPTIRMTRNVKEDGTVEEGVMLSTDPQRPAEIADYLRGLGAFARSEGLKGDLYRKMEVAEGIVANAIRCLEKRTPGWNTGIMEYIKA